METLLEWNTTIYIMTRRIFYRNTKLLADCAPFYDPEFLSLVQIGRA